MEHYNNESMHMKEIFETLIKEYSFFSVQSLHYTITLATENKNKQK